MLCMRRRRVCRHRQQRQRLRVLHPDAHTPAVNAAKQTAPQAGDVERHPRRARSGGAPHGPQGAVPGAGSGVVVHPAQRRSQIAVRVHRPTAPRTVKVSRLDGDSIDDDRVTQEARVLAAIQGRCCCIRLLDAWMTDQTVFLVMPRFDCSLAQLAANSASREKLKEPHFKAIATQLMHALAFLHGSGLVHRDVKLENILINADCTIALCDFNLARPADTDDGAAPMTPGMVTRWYRAPEVLLDAPYGTPVDVWAAGCTLMGLLWGIPSWRGRSSKEQLKIVFSELGLPRHNVLRRMGVEPSHAAEFMSDVLVQQGGLVLPEHTPEGLSHLLSRMLDMDPEARITASQALAHPFLADFDGAIVDLPALELDATLVARIGTAPAMCEEQVVRPT